MRNYRMIHLRFLLNKTQSQVAQAIGIGRSAYGMIERGQTKPRKNLMKKLADFYDVSVVDLFSSK